VSCTEFLGRTCEAVYDFFFATNLAEVDRDVFGDRSLAELFGLSRVRSLDADLARRAAVGLTGSGWGVRVDDELLVSAARAVERLHLFHRGAVERVGTFLPLLPGFVEQLEAALPSGLGHRPRDSVSGAESPDSTRPAPAPGPA
jgi:hypothetical protein